MTKSTRLSELPRMGNEEVAQNRQNQIPSLPLPVNTSLEHDINEDNDETIMEALRQLPQPPNAQKEQMPQMQMPQQQMPQQQMPQMPRMQQQMPQNVQQNQMQPSPSPSPSPSPQQVQQLQQLQQLQQQPREFYKNQNENNEDQTDTESHYDEDISERHIIKKGFYDIFSKNSEVKRMFIVMIVFIVVTFLPIEILISRHLNIEKFPYAGNVVKAILAGIFYFLIVNML